MIDPNAQLEELTIPAGSGPADPRIQITKDPPAALVAHYALVGVTVRAAILEWYDAETAWYTTISALTGTGIANRAQGWLISDGAGGLLVCPVEIATQTRLLPPFAPIAFGQDTPGSFVFGESGVGVALDPLQRVDILNSMHFQIDTREQGRGLLERIDAVAATAAIGAEAVTLTVPSATYRDGRCFAFRWRTQYTTTAAATISHRIRRTNLAGGIRAAYAQVLGAASGGTDIYEECRLKNASGADITDTMVLTAQASAGTVTHTGAATNVRYLEVWDIGDEADFANAAQI